MNKKTNNKESGFTIIEVVLVLAIAGLIFLIVFLALPQLQQSRRDTQRRNDASRIAAALESYAGNSNGNYPADSSGGTITTNFIPTYINGQNFDDPSDGNQYTYVDTTDGAAALDAGSWAYYQNAMCAENGEADTAGGFGDREIAVRMGLEQGIYCVDNQ